MGKLNIKASPRLIVDETPTMSVPDVSDASKMSPGRNVKFSPSRVVNSSVPDSVMTNCSHGAVCQSSEEPAAVLLEMRLLHESYGSQRKLDVFYMRATVSSCEQVDTTDYAWSHFLTNCDSMPLFCNRAWASFIAVRKSSLPRRTAMPSLSSVIPSCTTRSRAGSWSSSASRGRASLQRRFFRRPSRSTLLPMS